MQSKKRKVETKADLKREITRLKERCDLWYGHYKKYKNELTFILENSNKYLYKLKFTSINGFGNIQEFTETVEAINIKVAIFYTESGREGFNLINIERIE